MSKKRAKPVDMSVPPEERQRKRRNRMGGTPPAQVSHARGGRHARWRRDGEHRFEAERRLREDAARFAGEVAELDPAALADRVMKAVREDGYPAGG